MKHLPIVCFGAFVRAVSSTKLNIFSKVAKHELAFPSLITTISFN